LLLTAASNAAAPPGAGTVSAASEFVTATEQRPHRQHAEVPLVAGGAADLFRARPAAELHACVLPMLPILSSIIVGKGALDREGSGRGLTRTRGFVLALAYALGMAIVYTALGVAAGLSGEGLAAALQQPWVLALFAALLVALALSMFGFYELQLPAAGKTRLARPRAQQRRNARRRVHDGGDQRPDRRTVRRRAAGRRLAVHLANTRCRDRRQRAVRDGRRHERALLAGRRQRGLAAAARGPLDGVDQAMFGVLLIAVALWMVSPVIPAWAQMLAWAGFFIVSATYLCALDTLPMDASGWQRLGKGVGLMLLVLGAVQIVGAASGGRDVLRPLERLASGPGASETGSLAWRRVESVDQLDAALAGANGKPVLLDFYRGLVRVLQGDGSLHLQRSARRQQAGRHAVAAGRRDGEQR